MRLSAPAIRCRHRKRDGDRLPVCQNCAKSRVLSMFETATEIASSYLRRRPSQSPCTKTTGKAYPRGANNDALEGPDARREEHPCSTFSSQATASPSPGAPRHPHRGRKAVSASWTRAGTGYVSFGSAITVEKTGAAARHRASSSEAPLQRGSGRGKMAPGRTTHPEPSRLGHARLIPAHFLPSR